MDIEGQAETPTRVTLGSSAAQRSRKNFLRSTFAKTIFASLLTASGFSIISSVRTQNTALAFMKEFQGNNGFLVDLSNVMMGYSSFDYSVSLQGSLTECSPKRTIQTPEQCLEAVESLGLGADKAESNLVVGDWLATPRGCFLNGNALHFSTRAAEKEIQKERTSWANFSIICSKKDAELNEHFQGNEVGVPVEETNLNASKEETDLDTSNASKTNLEPNVTAKDDTESNNFADDNEPNSSASSPNYSDSNSDITKTQNDPINASKTNLEPNVTTKDDAESNNFAEDDNEPNSSASSPNYSDSKSDITKTQNDPIDIFLSTIDKDNANMKDVEANRIAVDTTVDLTSYKDYSYPSDPSREDDKDCIFLDSPLYRSVYVYPTWMNQADGWDGPILSSEYKDVSKWPWIDLEQEAKDGEYGHYGGANNQMGQYTLELIVRDLMTHPESCLRTMDPLKASLFYVPYLPSIEFHKGKTYAQDYSTSPYGSAIEEATKGKYDDWEKMFGLTSDFWKRKSGADHILVFSEPLHGLSHPRNRRGSYHFINTQKMLTPPIIISIEVSTTFVKKYPKCSAKNIVTPYPNPDGNWFNGEFDRLAIETWENGRKENASLEAEREKFSVSTLKDDIFQPRPFAQYYSAGAHGECSQLRKSMKEDYKCSMSSKVNAPYHLGMRMATFCPCPGGDSPSAKRMFDTINGGCIPIILSKDFVWPFTKEADPSIDMDPSLFSLRWNASDFSEITYDNECQLKNESKPSLQVVMENISAEEISKLRNGMRHASDLYSFWSKEGYSGSEFPLRDNIFPNGGASKAIVKLLAERAGGSRWPDCKIELEGRVEGQDTGRFEC